MNDEAEEGRQGEEGRKISLNLDFSEFSQLNFLAKGSMCKCFLGHGSSFGPGPVVLKMAIENGPEQAEGDLNTELHFLKGLVHPNLTLLLGAGSTPKRKTFLVMEYLEDGTLRRRLDAARGGLGFWPAVRHALELAKAMRYLHKEALPDMCILHRDLKPDNLGFSRGVMKLFDLGLAKAIKRSETGVNDFYRMSGKVGSLRYMSPEVASFQPYNEKADVHSFGVVVWELVTGWLPFAGISPPQFMYQVVKHGQRPLMQFRWNPVFKEFLASCWNENPRERPNFSKICETLESLLSAKALSETPRTKPVGSSGSSSMKKGGTLFSRIFKRGNTSRNKSDGRQV